GEGGGGMGGGEGIDGAMHGFERRSIEEEQAVAAREHPKAAAAAGAGRLAPRRLFGAEPYAVIRRPRDPHLPVILAPRTVRRDRVPGGINAAVAVGCDRAAAVNRRGARTQIALRLERGLLGVRS